MAAVASRRGSKGDRTLGRSIAWIPSANSRKARNKWRNACFRAITAANEARVVGSAATRQRRAPPAIKPVTNIVRGENIRQLLLQNSVARSCAHARTPARVCVHYTEAWNNAVPFMAKEEAVESPPARILQVYSKRKGLLHAISHYRADRFVFFPVSIPAAGPRRDKFSLSPRTVPLQD